MFPDASGVLKFVGIATVVLMLGCTLVPFALLIFDCVVETPVVEIGAIVVDELTIDVTIWKR